MSVLRVGKDGVLSENNHLWQVVVTLLLAMSAVLSVTASVSAEGEEPQVMIPEDGAPLAEAPQGAEPQAEDENPPVNENLEAIDGEQGTAVDEETPVDASPAQPEPVEPAPPEEGNQETPAVEDSFTGEESAAAGDATSDVEAPVLILVDENGETMDMASQSSADAIKAADPYFKVGSKYYRFMTDCSAYPDSSTSQCMVTSVPSIQAAIDYIRDNGTIPSDGKIYVESDTYEETITIDGSNPSLAKIRGLIGLESGGIFPTINGSLTASGLLSGFTLSGFMIEGGVAFDSITGTLLLENLYIHNDSGDGLVVENHNGNVELRDVQSRGNKGDGARIDNSASSRGSVKVSNSAFDYNNDETSGTWNTGLKILTNGAITLEGVAASHNNGSGAEVRGFSGLTINNSMFDSNSPMPASGETASGYGLYAETANQAAVRISNVFAYFNANNGIEIHTAGYVNMNYVRSSHSSLRVGAIDSLGETVYERLNEDNKYSGDRWYFSGVNEQVLEIVLSSQAFDTYLELYDASDDSLLASNDDREAGNTNSLINFTLGGDGEYYILVKMLPTAGGEDGSYSLALNDPLNENQTTHNIKGALINTSEGLGTVSISNAMFQDNVGDGLVVHSLRNITIRTTDNSHNSMRGAYLNTCQRDEEIGICMGYGSISITSSASAGWYGGNYFLDNGDSGLVVESKNSITLTNIGAYDNQGSGIDLRNDFGNGSITINANVTNFTNVFRNNGIDGVTINSQGTVRLYSSAADYNAGYGFYINTKGSIVLKDLSASVNGKNGLYTNNQIDGSRGSVTLTSSRGVRNVFDQNGALERALYRYPGVEVRSYGNISLSYVDARENFAAGIYLTNQESPYGRYVKLTDSDTSKNQGSGLLVYSKGAVYLRGVSSSYNSLTGSDIIYPEETVHDRLTAISSYDNWWFTAPPGSHANIILESTEFDGYLQLFDALGNLVASDDNTYEDYNAQIDMDLEPGEYYIHVSSANMEKGNYTLSINDPEHNSSTYFSFYGALVDNSSGSSSVVIYPSTNWGFNTFDDNNYRGLQIITNGSITAYNLSASENGDAGVYFDNQAGSGKITIYNRDRTTVGAYNNNSGWGLFAASSKAVTLQNISADGNGSAGAFINNCLLSGGVCHGSGSVYLKSAYGLANSFSGNQLYGLWISSGGSVVIYDIAANANGRSGLYVKNQYDGVSGYVILKASRGSTNTFLTNGWASLLNYYGIEVYSNGNISLSSSNVQTTNGSGALLRNQTAPTARTISISDSTFEGNQGWGLKAYSQGLISLKGVDSRYNSLVNGQIDLFGETVYEHLSPNIDSDRWWFNGNAEETVDIILTSSEFDVILEVFNKDNELIATDDDSFGGTDARLTFDLLEDGDYYIKVRQNGSGDGNYILSLNDPAGIEVYSLYNFDGAYLNNTFGNGGVIVSYTSANPSPNFYHNNNNGITIETTGSVTMANVYAMQNGADGANIQNATGSGRVTVYSSSRSATSSFSYNTKFGLFVESAGLVTIKNSGRMYLRDNGYSGAYIDNRSLSAADINISRVEVNNNLMKGMEINSGGDVTLNNILAIHNATNGVYVDNCNWDAGSLACLGSGYVNIRGSLGENTFSDNGDTGLAVYSNGNITIDKTFAVQNAGRGMVLSNETGTGTIRVYNTITRLNEWHGMHLITNGLVSLRSVHSMSNGLGTDGDGIYLRAASPAQVSMYKCSFLGNVGNGIEIEYDAYGLPALSYVSYFGNDTDLAGYLNYYAHQYIP